MPNYRVTVHYDRERSVFVARAPELEHCSAEGATRAEALTRVEEEIDAQLRNMSEHGAAPPPALDEDDASLTGEISAKVSRGLQRELLLQARAEGVELGQLVAEMLAGGLDARRARARRPQGPPREPRDADAQPRGGAGAGGGPPDRRGGFGRDQRGQGGRYHAIMEDRATFLEYVRGLESGQAPGRGGGPRRPRGRGRPGGDDRGPGGNDDDGSENK